MDNSIDSVTFYNVKPIKGVGRPFLIVVVSSKDHVQWSGEMYLLLHDQDCTVLTMVQDANGGAWKAAGLALTKETFRGELIQQARRLFSVYREDSGQDDQYGVLTGQIELTETELVELFSFWRQSPCSHRLQFIERNTSSEGLRQRLKIALSRQRLDDELQIIGPPTPPSSSA
jgi:hypothetical protein